MSVSRITLVLALSACGFSGHGALDAASTTTSDAPDGGSSGPWLDGYRQRKAITLTGGAVALEDFPANIAVSDPALVGDVAFTSADGTSLLSFELVTLEDGALDAWVRTDVAAGSPTTLYLYFDGDPHPHAPASEAWTAYAGVWHMTYAADGNSDDSVAASRAVNADPNKQPGKADGISGAARMYDGADDYLEVGNPAELEVGVTSFAFAVWVNLIDNTGNYDMPMWNGGSSSNRAGFDIELGAGPWVTSLNDDTSTPQQEVPFATAGLYGDWHFLVGVIDRQRNLAKTYLDGALVESAAYGKGTMDSTVPMTIGDNVYRIHGRIDEVRVYRFAPELEWIALEYANLAKREMVVAIGATETR